MAKQSIVEAVQNYIRVLRLDGIPVDFAVLYGSYARGKATEWSDIDVMVVSPLFDQEKRREDFPTAKPHPSWKTYFSRP